MARELEPYGPGTARFSPCATWRYELDRDLRACPFDRTRQGILLAIGLNPSTANSQKDDPTVHKESGWAVAWGYAFYVKLNAYAFRATLPKDMFAAKKRGVDIVGPENDAALIAAIARVRHEGGRVLAGWGRHADADRQRAIARLLTDVEVVCVEVNENGSPAHPLYKNLSKLGPWTCPPPAPPKPPKPRRVRTSKNSTYATA
jgi:hypothetical protein